MQPRSTIELANAHGDLWSALITWQDKVQNELINSALFVEMQTFSLTSGMRGIEIAIVNQLNGLKMSLTQLKIPLIH